MMDPEMKEYSRYNISNSSAASSDVFEPTSVNDAKLRTTVIEWLNSTLPNLNLPVNASDEELRNFLVDGTILCRLMNKLRPASAIEYGNPHQSSEAPSENVKKFLAAMDEMRLPHFNQSELEKGSMKIVSECLLTLKALFMPKVGLGSPTNSSPNIWGSEAVRWRQLDEQCGTSDVSQDDMMSPRKFQRVLRSPMMSEPTNAMMHHAGHKFHEVFQMKHGGYSDLPASKISELMKSNSLDIAPTQSLLSMVNGILDESISRKNGEIPHRVACLMRKVVQEIERRISTQAEHLRTQNNLFKTREEKYQSRIRVLEALANGTGGESKVAPELNHFDHMKMMMSPFDQIKVDVTRTRNSQKDLIEFANSHEEKKNEEHDIERIMKERDSQSAEIERIMKEKDGKSAEIERITKEKDGKNAEIERIMKEKDGKNAEIERILQEKDSKSAEIERIMQEKDSKNAEIERIMKEKDSKNAEIERLTKEKDSKSAEIERLMKEKDSRSAEIERLTKEKDSRSAEVAALRQELEKLRRKHDEYCLQIEVAARKTQVGLEEKLKEVENLLNSSKVKVQELEANSQSKMHWWNKKEHTYKTFTEFQLGALKELRFASQSVRQEFLKSQKSYSEDFDRLGTKVKVLQDAAESYQVAISENRQLHNEIQELKGNIRVYCRVRPFLPSQKDKQTSIDYIGENGEIIIANPSKPGKESRKSFKFNKVYGSRATQAEVYGDIQQLIRSVLDGYNVCIFAYGQTGAGKTYTMSGPDNGTEEDWGVNYRALNDLFKITQSRKSTFNYEVGVQMVEIYNEQVRDLLASDTTQKKLGILVAAQSSGLAVPDANMRQVNEPSDVMGVMEIGFSNRARSSTSMNERSSRSHSVVTIHVHGTELQTGVSLHGSLHLVDLAGSERIDRSEVIGDRLKEAQHINKSLAALGDVFFSLSSKSVHVPFRNSKLTQVLQSSLGGQAKTLMFVNLNPEAVSYVESLSTLKFAERVSGVELGPARSSKDGSNIKQLMEQVASLKEALSKKDEEIERQQLLREKKNTLPSVPNERRSSKYGSASSSPVSGASPKSNTRSAQRNLPDNRRKSFDGFRQSFRNAEDTDNSSVDGSPSREGSRSSKTTKTSSKVTRPLSKISKELPKAAKGMFKSSSGNSLTGKSPSRKWP